MKTSIIGCLCAIILIACTKEQAHDPGDACDGVPKSFAANVNPIIQTVCGNASCHGPGSFNGPGELLTYNQVFNARTAIRTAVSTGFMPQNSTLSTAQKNTIICWIDNGAPNN